MEEYYKKEVPSILNELQTSRKGLSDKEAKDRLEKYGLNELKETKKRSAIVMFLQEFVNPLIFVLIIAVVVSFFVKHFLDAFVILAIIILNAILGFSQEYKVEKAIELLKKLSNPKATVIRNNENKTIPANELVVGDIIVLRTGDKVSADCRLIEAINLEMDESILTGESTSVAKNIDVISNNKPISEQSNMVFAGTNVSYGRGIAVVISSGMNTQLGNIAYLVQKVKSDKTPLQKRLGELGNWLGTAIIIISFLVFVAGYLKGLDTFELFLASISLAVSAIPEGLPAVVTITLALGVRRMLKKNALVRRIQSIETLGAITVICSDKTGTLTKNEMSISEIYTNKEVIDFNNGFFSNGKRIDPKRFLMLLKIAKNCNDASLEPEMGDPTEIALLKLSSILDIKEEKRIGEIPFDSEKKYMITIHKDVSYIKGAPEKILKLCEYLQNSDSLKKMNNSDKKEILKQSSEMAKKALRVLALAYKTDGKNVFVGLVGMRDPPRKEVKDAIRICCEAGIRPIMITGDHKLTAEAVAAEIGITGKAIEGSELNKLSDKELKEIVKEISIFARVDPEHKVKILEALQANGEIVAMTGDGVNDAPALKKADVGVAMSIKGTDVARDASEIVLIDDNFASIVKAVKEGRVIYDNIKKFIKYLLSVNFAEISLLFTTILLGLPLPLLPLQILWINLATDSLPALALGVEPAEADIMKRKPRNPKEHIMHKSLWFIIWIGFLSFISMFLVFCLSYLTMGKSIEVARTMTLSTSILFQLIFVFSMRSEKKTIFELGVLSNRYMFLSVALAVALHLVLIYSPIGTAFGLVPLDAFEWLIIICFSSIGFVFNEFRKVVGRC